MNKVRSHNAMSMSAVLSAVQECRAKPLGDPQRIIVLLGSAGLALPQTDRKALRHSGAVLVPAERLDQNRLRFIKLLAHRTRLVPLLLASIEVWRAWSRRRTLEAARIRRRTHLVVLLDEPSPENT